MKPLGRVFAAVLFLGCSLGVLAAAHADDPSPTIAWTDDTYTEAYSIDFGDSPVHFHAQSSDGSCLNFALDPVGYASIADVTNACDAAVVAVNFVPTALGDYPIDLHASSATAPTVSRHFVLHVIPPSGPVFGTEPTEYTMNVLDHLTVDVDAYKGDPLGGCLTITVSALPEGVSMQEDGLGSDACAEPYWARRFDVAPAQAGDHLFTITAQYEGLKVVRGIVVHVLKLPTTLVADAAVATVRPPTVGVPLKTMARLTSNGAPVAGRTITFRTKAGGTICSARTAANGVASCAPVTSALQAVPNGYVATFAGDTIYTPSSSSGVVVRVLSVTLP